MYELRMTNHEQQQHETLSEARRRDYVVDDGNGAEISSLVEALSEDGSRRL